MENFKGSLSKEFEITNNTFGHKTSCITYLDYYKNLDLVIIFIEKKTNIF